MIEKLEISSPGRAFQRKIFLPFSSLNLSFQSAVIFNVIHFLSQSIDELLCRDGNQEEEVLHCRPVCFAVSLFPKTQNHQGTTVAGHSLVWLALDSTYNGNDFGVQYLLFLMAYQLVSMQSKLVTLPIM